jgi:hypothetical protein
MKLTIVLNSWGKNESLVTALRLRSGTAFAQRLLGAASRREELSLAQPLVELYYELFL